MWVAANMREKDKEKGREMENSRGSKSLPPKEKSEAAESSLYHSLYSAGFKPFVNISNSWSRSTFHQWFRIKEDSSFLILKRFNARHVLAEAGKQNRSKADSPRTCVSKQVGGQLDNRSIRPFTHRWFADLQSPQFANAGRDTVPSFTCRFFPLRGFSSFFTTDHVLACWGSSRKRYFSVATRVSDFHS